MRMTKWYWGILVFTLLTIGLQWNCRSRKRAEQAPPGGKVEVFIKVKNLDEVHQSKLSLLQYQLRCDDGPWVAGSLKDEQEMEVRFFMSKVGVGSRCSMEVLTPEPDDNMKFLHGDRVMYGTADNIELGTKIGGLLWAEAILSRFYTLKDKGRQLVVPVQFPENELPVNTSEIFTELKCSPELESLAIGLKNVNRNKGQAQVVFDSGIKPEVNYSCHKLQMFVNKTPAFWGDLDQSFGFKPEATEVVLQPVTVQKVELTTVSGITIITTDAGACAPDEVFDVVKRECTKLPKAEK